MSPFHRIHFVATAFVIGVAGACMVPPAIASSPVSVTFQPNTHWVQEVDTLDHYDYYHDYSVAIEPGKILQINLITRDPNIFFKIKNETSGKQLVDTYKTGATTWSAPAGTAAATYTIHVYVQPDAMQRDEKPKYALQIGQYGQSDMQVEATTVTFENNNPWAQEVGTLDAQGSARDYAVAVTAGQMLAVNLVTQNANVHFKVEANGQKLVDSADTHAATWSAPVAAAGTYTVNVYADPSALPPGTRAGYTLQIGHYAQNETQAAPAGTVAAPASTATAATPATAGTSGN
ncbi:MAG TPA: hypothetical protein VJ823_03750 [Rhodanobacteraceae bacterium]|nr:hypothetical protein [Rhodanobacteraceae bacterium]